MESVKKSTVQARTAPTAGSNTKSKLNQLQTVLAMTHSPLLQSTTLGAHPAFIRRCDSVFNCGLTLKNPPSSTDSCCFSL